MPRLLIVTVIAQLIIHVSSDPAGSLKVEGTVLSYTINFDTDVLEKFHRCLCGTDNYHCSVEVKLSSGVTYYYAYNPAHKSIKENSSDSLSNIYHCSVEFGAAFPDTVDCKRSEKEHEILDFNLRAHVACKPFFLSGKLFCDPGCIELKWDSSLDAEFDDIQTSALSCGHCGEDIETTVTSEKISTVSKSLQSSAPTVTDTPTQYNTVTSSEGSKVRTTSTGLFSGTTSTDNSEDNSDDNSDDNTEDNSDDNTAVVTGVIIGLITLATVVIAVVVILQRKRRGLKVPAANPSIHYNNAADDLGDHEQTTINRSGSSSIHHQDNAGDAVTDAGSYHYSSVDHYGSVNDGTDTLLSPADQSGSDGATVDGVGSSEIFNLNTAAHVYSRLHDQPRNMQHPYGVLLDPKENNENTPDVYARLHEETRNIQNPYGMLLGHQETTPSPSAPCGSITSSDREEVNYSLVQPTFLIPANHCGDGSIEMTDISNEDGQPITENIYHNEDGQPITENIYHNEDGQPITENIYHNEDGQPITENIYQNTHDRIDPAPNGEAPAISMEGRDLAVNTSPKRASGAREGGQSYNYALVRKGEK